MFFLALLVPVAVLAGSGQGLIAWSAPSRPAITSTPLTFPSSSRQLHRRQATHGGVANLHMAEFENFSQAVDGDELNRMVQEKLGSGWERIIRETSRQGTDQTLIYMHPEATAWASS